MTKPPSSTGQRRSMSIGPPPVPGLEQADGPTEAATIVEVMGHTVTAHEMIWIEAIREASALTDPALTRGARSFALSLRLPDRWCADAESFCSSGRSGNHREL